MNITITEFSNGQGTDTSKVIDQLPDTCSICHHSGTIIFKMGYLNLHGTGVSYVTRRLQLLVQCPRNECKRYAIAYYIPTSSSYQSFYYERSLPHTPTYTLFSDSVKEISPEFIEIHKQAGEAEAMGLDKIAGVGYRKALEFLIKDYLIQVNPDRAEAIKKKALGNCIKDDVTDTRLKAVSERAVWLGNDETHYTRIWDNKDLNDLKDLITLSSYWIDSEYLTAKLVKDMPKPVKKAQ